MPFQFTATLRKAIRFATALAALALLVLCSASANAQDPQLNLEKGDHIAIIGNTMADRMQHDGWFEAMTQARFPEHELVIRNLGFSADTLKIRQRNAQFGSPDERLAEVKADVVLLMFGFNESFDGFDGIETFRTDLIETIDSMSKQKYNGKSAPRLVLVSPIAHEDLKNPNLPDGKENNLRLRVYRNTMQSVAKEKKIPFIDLYTDTLKQFSKSGRPLTDNGVHLNFAGNRLIAELMTDSLFGKVDADKSSSPEELEKIRTAVQAKNFYWYNYYRTVDGYSMYGARADLKFVDGQTNRVVMRRELDVLWKMVENRDPKIWATVQGKDFTVDDSNTPDFLPVVTNIRGDKEDGSHTFPAGEEIIKKMKMPEGFEVKLFASEEQFPELVNPVQMAFDTKGRLWVAAWQSYPHWKPKTKMNDKLLILEDTDGDGVADECKTFASGLHNPTGFEFYGDGVIVAMQPNILFLRDSDGDDVADQKTRLLHGFDSADTHHAANSFVLGPGGGLYFQEGLFHRSQVESPYGPVRLKDAGVWRYEPRTAKLQVYANYGFANPHGHTFNQWGQDIIHDATSSQPFDATLINGHMPWPNKHRSAPLVYSPRTRPCPATEMVSSRNFPLEMQEELLVQNVIGDHGILRYKVSEDGASLTAEELEPLLTCDDPRFRPVDLEFGPKGDLYFTDWTNPIIGHMQHNVRDPNRDQEHGRVYRMYYKQRPLATPPKVAGATIEELVNLLANPISRIRYRAKIELSQHDSQKVIAAVNRWSTPFLSAANNPTNLHHLLEALWVHQHHNIVNESLLTRLMRAPDHRVRAAATRVAVYWRDQLPSALSLISTRALDPHPRVRLEAARAASFFESSEAISIIATVMGKPTDKYLDYVINESLKVFPNFKFEPSVFKDANQASVDFFLDRMPVAEASQLPMDARVAQHLLFREGAGKETRTMAVEKLAQLGKQKPVDVLIDSLSKVTTDSPDRATVNELVAMLGSRSNEEMKSVRARLEAMATKNPMKLVREIGYAGMIIADEDAANAARVANESFERKLDLANSMRMIPDPSLQSKLYAILQPMAVEAGDPNDANKIAPRAKFVRIELPGANRTLTLAEVEVYSNGENIALGGTATQSATGNGGSASKGIDGNRSGLWGRNGQTHTPENQPNPWWELDLKEPSVVNKIAIYNRTEGSLGKRLDQFTLKVLDANRQVIFSKTEIPAPTKSDEFSITSESKASRLRRSALKSMALVRGKESETATMLTDVLVSGKQVGVAINAMNQIPSRFWPADKAKAMSEIVMKHIRSMPAADRGSAEATDSVRMAKSLADLLPARDAAKLRTELADLNVKTIRLGTKPHRMAYDQDQLVVKPGRAVELIFENTDMMPHNLVIVTPGNLATIGQTVEDNAAKLTGGSKPFVPESNEILLASKLVQPTQSQTMTFETPTTPGVYPYVCTYPGHWRRMYGALVVVEDPAKYAANPDQYLADNKIEIKDEILAVKRTTTEWKFADFESKFEKEFAGRDFKQGQQMFKLASCISCHQLQGEGVAIGQNLNELNPEYKPIDVLREILEPSLKIDEKYQTQKFAMESGEIISGVVVFEDDLLIRYVENPLASTEPRNIRKLEIEDRSVSKVSIMPKGLLDTLTRDEILDLVAYVYSKGDNKNDVYEGGHDH